MTDHQIALVRATWALLGSRELQFAELCYEEFFRKQPALRTLFEGFMDEQHRRFGETVNRTVDRLDAPEDLRQELASLGERPEGYHVRSEHHPALRDAMVTTLERLLGADFTPEVREAWIIFYGYLKEGLAVRA